MRHGGILIEANDSEGEAMKKHTSINQSLPADAATCTTVAVDLAKRVFPHCAYSKKGFRT